MSNVIKVTYYMYLLVVLACMGVVLTFLHFEENLQVITDNILGPHNRDPGDL